MTHLAFAICGILLIWLQCSNGSVNFKNCGSKANVTEVDVTGCTQQPCIFYRGMTYDFKIQAVATYETHSLPFKVTAKVLSISKTLFKGDACDQLSQGKCPTQNGDRLEYEHKVLIGKKFPKVSAKITANVKDDIGNTFICVQFTAKIK